MLAHVEQVQHAHPHPAGLPWEAVLLGAMALLVVAVVLVAGRALQSRLGTESTPAVEEVTDDE